MARDGSCQFPGCTRRRNLHAHHIQAWSLGGPTDMANLILLCQAHHVAVHEASITITGHSGAWRFTRVGGIEITAQRYQYRAQHDDTWLLEDLLGDLTGITDYFDPRAEKTFPLWGGAREGRRGGLEALYLAANLRAHNNRTNPDNGGRGDSDGSGSGDDDRDDDVPAGTPEDRYGNVPAGTREPANADANLTKPAMSAPA